MARIPKLGCLAKPPSDIAVGPNAPAPSMANFLLPFCARRHEGQAFDAPMAADIIPAAASVVGCDVIRPFRGSATP